MTLASSLAALKTVASRPVDWMKSITLLQANKQAILDDSLRTLQPTIQQQLRTKLAASGLHSRTGAMAAAVGNSTVAVSKGGRLKVVFPAGLPAKVYAYSAAHNYGAVQGGGSKAFKKIIKSAAAKGAATGRRVQPAHHYYRLDPTAIGLLSAKLTQQFQARVDKLGGK